MRFLCGLGGRFESYSQVSPSDNENSLTALGNAIVSAVDELVFHAYVSPLMRSARWWSQEPSPVLLPRLVRFHYEFRHLQLEQI